MALSVVSSKPVLRKSKLKGAGRIRDGGYLISVHCDDNEWARRAQGILEATGGRDVVKTSEARADYRP